MAKKNRITHYLVNAGIGTEMEADELKVEGESGIYLKPTGRDVIELPARPFNFKPQKIALYPAGHALPWPINSAVVATPGVPRPADFKTLFGEYLPNLVRRALMNLDMAKWQTKDWIVALIAGGALLLAGGALLVGVQILRKLDAAGI
jgi:hypothetical protein